MSQVQSTTDERRQLIDLIAAENAETNPYNDRPSVIVDAKEICSCRLVLIKRIKKLTGDTHHREYIDAVLVTADNKILDLENTGWESNGYCTCDLCHENGRDVGLSMVNGKFICENCREGAITEIQTVRAAEAYVLLTVAGKLLEKRKEFDAEFKRKTGG